jgi:hypothetical protein
MSNTYKIDGHSEISDIRTPSQFKGITFSGFKKTEVRAQFVENLKKGRVEQACYWCAEMVCSGHYLDIWETLLYFMGKHIHLGNPKMAIYLQLRYQIFRNIVSQGFFPTELHLRNHSSIRKLFAELVCNITLSNKKPGFETIKINREEEFDMTQLHERLKATSTEFIAPVFKKDDAKELWIGMNELAYNLSPGVSNMNNACYWIEWVIEFEAICKRNGTPTKCEARNYPVENKYRRDMIWIVWDILQHYVAERNDGFISKTLGALIELFCIKYTPASSKKRRYLLYFAVELCTETVPTNVEMIANKEVLEIVVSQINNVYKQIKQNEHAPNTEYLFANIREENRFEQMIAKLETLNSMSLPH